MVIFVVWTKALDKAESIIYQLPQWFHPGLQQNRFAGLSVGEAMLQSRALRQHREPEQGSANRKGTL